MASLGGKTRKTASLREIKRRDRRLDDEEAGFTEHRHTDTQEKNYNHDREDIKFYSYNIGQAGKTLWKLQGDIARKSKKRKSRWLEKCKQDYDQSLKDMVKDLKQLMAIVGGKDDYVPRQEKASGRCTAECFQREKDMLRKQAEIDSLNEELLREREAKQEALTRLSAITSSRLRDNNPNLTDLSDPYRPSKIGEMFSELYDNEWTNAYDELSQTNSEVDTIQQLNAIVMTAYDCCMKLSMPSRSYLDTSLTKIDSELRQKIIGHFKQNGMVVIQQLSQDLETEICARCNLASKSTGHVTIYIQKCIEICWLMVVQDPPIALDNSKPEKFDSSKYRGYQHNGPYTAYVVWPAITLYRDGPMLSKGVAEGSDTVKRFAEGEAVKQTGIPRPTGERTTKQNTKKANPMNQTCYTSRVNVRNPSSTTSGQTSTSTNL